MRLSRPLAALAVTATLFAGLVAAPSTASATSSAPTVTTAEHRGGDRVKPRVKRFDLKGRITAVDADAHTMTVQVRVRKHGRVKATRLVELIVSTEARIRVNGLAAEEGDLVVGDRVKVRGVVQENEDGSRTLVAKRVAAYGERSTLD